MCVGVRACVHCQCWTFKGLERALDVVWMLWCGSKTHTKRRGEGGAFDLGLASINSSTRPAALLHRLIDSLFKFKCGYTDGHI